MMRSLLTLSCLAAALTLAGCASEPAAPAAPADPAAAAAAAANDAAIAGKLKGNWTGTWTLAGYGGGKFELIVTDVSGASIKGDANWYGTATGDNKGPLTKAAVKNGTLVAEQPTISFKLSLKGDTLSGTWSAGGYSGPLTAKR